MKSHLFTREIYGDDAAVVAPPVLELYSIMNATRDRQGYVRMYGCEDTVDIWSLCACMICKVSPLVIVPLLYVGMMSLTQLVIKYYCAFRCKATTYGRISCLQS